MKKLFLMLLINVLATAAVSAQSRKIEQAKAWKNFQTAIAGNDRRAVAALIEFPFEASIIGEDLNFRIESEDDFLKNYAKIFNPARRRKIAGGKAVLVAGAKDEFNFEMPENGAHHVFTFRKVGGKYKLVGTMAAG